SGRLVHPLHGKRAPCGGRRDASRHTHHVPPHRPPLVRRAHAVRRTRRLEARGPGRGAPERPAPLSQAPVGYTRICAREGWTIAGRGEGAGGKPGLHGAGCWETPGGGNPRDKSNRKETAVL